MDDLVCFFAVHPLTAKVERTLGRLVNAGDEVEHGGFTGTVGTDKTDQLGLADLHVEIIYGL